MWKYVCALVVCSAMFVSACDASSDTNQSVNEKSSGVDVEGHMMILGDPGFTAVDEQVPMGDLRAQERRGASERPPELAQSMYWTHEVNDGQGPKRVFHFAPVRFPEEVSARSGGEQALVAIRVKEESGRLVRAVSVVVPGGAATQESLRLVLDRMLSGGDTVENIVNSREALPYNCQEECDEGPLEYGKVIVTVIASGEQARSKARGALADPWRGADVGTVSMSTRAFGANVTGDCWDGDCNSAHFELGEVTVVASRDDPRHHEEWRGLATSWRGRVHRGGGQGGVNPVPSRIYQEKDFCNEDESECNTVNWVGSSAMFPIEMKEYANGDQLYTMQYSATTYAEIDGFISRFIVSRIQTYLKSNIKENNKNIDGWEHISTFSHERSRSDDFGVTSAIYRQSHPQKYYTISSAHKVKFITSFGNEVESLNKQGSSTDASEIPTNLIPW